MKSSDSLSLSQLSNHVLRPIRDGYGEALVELGKTNPDVIVLSGDVTESTRSLEFAKQFPDRFIEVGVAEQNMAGIAAGMALEGFIPFMSGYAVFSPGRNWDQVRVSICYSNLDVKIAGCHAGVSVGPDGASHQALEDIAIARVLPHMTVLVPADAVQAKQATIAAASWPGPVYIRLAREKTPVFIDRDLRFEIGKAQILREGSDVTIAACGPMVYKALEAAEVLSRGSTDVVLSRVARHTLDSGSRQGSSSLSDRPISKSVSNIYRGLTGDQFPRKKTPVLPGIFSAEVINVHTIKPLDVEALVKSVKKTGRLVTVEDHQIIGGLGGAIAEALAEEHPVPMVRVGMQDTFGESGDPEELLAKYGMDANAIINAVGRVIRFDGK